MEFPETIIPTDILLKQICSVCSKYLSVGPVMMDAFKSICGRCTENYPNKGFLKKSMYNKLAESLIFKCINHFQGCNAVVRFNEMSQHESECNKNEWFSCYECSFECETGCELIAHYRNKHPQNVIQNNKINIQLKEKDECYIFWHLDTIISVKLTITQVSLRFKMSPWICKAETDSSICYLHLSNGRSKLKYVMEPIKMFEEVSVDLENLTCLLNHKGFLLIELNINTGPVTLEEMFSKLLIRCYLKDQEIKIRDDIIIKKSNESLRKSDTLNLNDPVIILIYCTTCHKYDYQNEKQICSSNRSICSTCNQWQPVASQNAMEQNVASSRNGSKVVAGELKDNLLDGDYYSYDMDKGYTRHRIMGPGDQGIVVKLGVPSVVNHIRMLLWDRELRSYSYYIEVSMEQKDWVRVVDYSQYCCRSWQNLYFENRVVQYIRIVGTHCTANPGLHVVSFEAMCTGKVPKMRNDIIWPNYNVATVDKSAVVIEGVSRVDWNFGYPSHELGSETTLIQLAQPYIIASLSLLLRNCDDRTYSYYIESSINMREWEMVTDSMRECKSWQVIRFPPRPVVFIRIVGRHNTENEVFHCVHFECPSCEDDDNQTCTVAVKVANKNSSIAGSGSSAEEPVNQFAETAAQANVNLNK